MGRHLKPLDIGSTNKDKDGKIAIIRDRYITHCITRNLTMSERVDDVRLIEYIDRNPTMVNLFLEYIANFKIFIPLKTRYDLYVAAGGQHDDIIDIIHNHQMRDIAQNRLDILHDIKYFHKYPNSLIDVSIYDVNRHSFKNILTDLVNDGIIDDYKILELIAGTRAKNDILIDILIDIGKNMDIPLTDEALIHVIRPDKIKEIHDRCLITDIMNLFTVIIPAFIHFPIPDSADLLKKLIKKHHDHFGKHNVIYCNGFNDTVTFLARDQMISSILELFSVSNMSEDKTYLEFIRAIIEASKYDADDMYSFNFDPIKFGFALKNQFNIDIDMRDIIRVIIEEGQDINYNIDDIEKECARKKIQCSIHTVDDDGFSVGFYLAMAYHDPLAYYDSISNDDDLPDTLHPAYLKFFVSKRIKNDVISRMTDLWKSLGYRVIMTMKNNMEGIEIIDTDKTTLDENIERCILCLTDLTTFARSTCEYNHFYCASCSISVRMIMKGCDICRIAGKI